LAILDDPDRTFVASDYLRLELLPKPLCNGYADEAEFYRAYFESVAAWVKSSPELSAAAFERACQFNLSALDALHVVAAEQASADELVTAEKPQKPITLVKTVSVRSIRVGT
jgi:hypothetical protein